MLIEVAFRVELPFVLNLPDDVYSVTLPEGTTIDVELNNNLYGFLIIENGRVLTRLLSKAEVERSAIPAHKLKTFIILKISEEHELGNLPELDNGQILEHIKGEIVKARPINVSGPIADEDAQNIWDNTSPENKFLFVLQKRAEFCARNIIQSNENPFIKCINLLIRKYSIEFDDIFVEEISLHQLGSRLTKGIHTISKADGHEIDNSHIAEKFPPILNSPWFNWPIPKIDSFRNELGKPTEPNFIKVLQQRAKNMLEKRMTRSSIVEAAAALEISVARKINEKMLAAGKIPTEVEQELENTKMDFPTRAEQQLKTWNSGIGVIEIDNALWNRILNHRRQFRNSVVHSDNEPDLADANLVVTDFIEMTEKIEAQ